MRDAARRKRRRRRRKKKGRTWAEAARTVLEKYHNTPMSHKEILQVIQREGLKEISGTSPLACLNAMLHTNSRGDEGMFYKVPGRMGVYTLKKDVADMVKDLSDCSEDSNEAQSDSQSSESSCSTSSTSAISNKEPRRSCWKRKVTSRLSQPSSPPSSCPSPPIPAGKVISPSQKLSKKALKQALKQQKKQQQRRRSGIPVPTGQHLMLKTVKTASNVAPSKPPAAHRHLKRTKGAEIDVETPDSILVNTNLRALINKHTFSLLPVDGQQRLLLLLPEVDRPAGPDGLLKLNSSALNNEFFTSASQSWKERLSEGEFTPEMQLRIRQEIEKEKKVESWKEQFYESYYGENSGLSEEDLSKMTAEEEAEDKVSPPIVHNTMDPAQDTSSSPSVEQQHPVKTEDDQDNHEIPKVTEAIKEPETRNVAVIDKTTIEDENQEVKEETETTNDESKDKEPKSHTCTTPVKPKSPTQVESLRTMASEDDFPESSPEKSEATTPSLGTKRRLEVGEDPPAAPEKSPRMMELSRSPQSFRALCKPPTETQQHTPEQKVPPLKIPVAWLSPKPFRSCQVSPRPTFPTTGTSPSRTGARTLADIKAKARLARAARAAAVAAHGGSIPGPGPGGGPAGGPTGEIGSRILDLGNTGSRRSERGTSPSKPDNQNQREVTKPVQASPDSSTRTQLLQKPCVQPGFTDAYHQLRPSESKRHVTQITERGNSRRLTQEPITSDNSMQSSEILKASASGSSFKIGRVLSLESTGVPSVQSTKRAQNEEESKQITATPPFSSAKMVSCHPQPETCFIKSRTSAIAHGIDKVPSTQTHDLSAKPLRLGSGQHTKSSSSIPANNPLVTQLLQGKNVPLEQIMPRPLKKVETRTVPLSSVERPQGAIQGLETFGREEGERPSSIAAQQLERFLCHNRQHPSGQRIWQLFSGKDLTSSSNNPTQGPEEHVTSQEQVLQTLIKKVWQENTNSSELNSDPFVSERENISQRFMLGFLGRRTSKPAMSGHYLLNISTYGRVPEVCRQAPSDNMVDTSLNEAEHLVSKGSKTELITESGEEDTETDNHRSPSKSQGISSPKSEAQKTTRNEFLPTFDVKESVQIVTKGNIYSESDIARDLIQAAQAQISNVLGVRLKHNASDMFGIHASSTSPHPELLPSSRTCGNPAGLLGSGYGGRINISTSPEVLNRSSIPISGNFSPANTDNVVSFSVTVTTIPSSQSVGSGGCEQPISVQAYTDDGSMEMSPSNCYCRLKAMIMCKGCGAFCHDDCIGPSKLCVSCLVVR
ncbi:putative Polycomb group protein ASXL2 isoform X1 [Bufo gargarizans]|uniref:putative Polycomb group protein ASXL2 isoform X1 n=1 Tax=Bufo gargarizans TaxID=30331 RepID=UPI001CF275C0|nr:putative Polycomb group protein ASXL2 isoform X1 [Bufo gargarizans]